eukprot:jgi/Bigna1/59459/fgenesh1_kg.4_\
MAKCIGSWEVITPSGVFIRKNPDKTSEELGVIQLGDIIDAYEVQQHWIRHIRGWSQIRKDDGSILLSKCVESGQALGKWIVVSKGGVYIRLSPSAEAKDVGVLNIAEEVLGLKTAGDWLQHKRGWSLMRKKDGTVLLGIQWVVVAHHGLRIRKSPDKDSQQIGLLVYDEKLAQIQLEGKWLQHEKGWSQIETEDGKP